MEKPMSDAYYEDKFEFPLWKLIKQRARKKDISYVKACAEVVPEYVRTIRYRDTAFENEAIQKRFMEMVDLFAKQLESMRNVSHEIKQEEEE